VSVCEGWRWLHSLSHGHTQVDIIVSYLASFRFFYSMQHSYMYVGGMWWFCVLWLTQRYTRALAFAGWPSLVSRNEKS